LNLVVPETNRYGLLQLRIAVADRDGIETEQDYELHIQGVAADSAVQVKDFSFNPER